MSEALLASVPYLKALHIAGLIVWCGGLFALPMMLAWHDPAIGQADYRRIRHASHFICTLAVTPAAVIALIAGTWLALARPVVEPWTYLKLAAVGVLVALQAWIGHNVVEVAERAATPRPPSPLRVSAGLLAVILAILVLVLGKPELGEVEMPDRLTEPRQRHGEGHRHRMDRVAEDRDARVGLVMARPLRDRVDQRLALASSFSAIVPSGRVSCLP